MAKVYNKQQALHSLLITVVELIQQEEPDFDVVEVVRCKDCIHYSDHYCDALHLSGMFRNWYCGDAERRE